VLTDAVERARALAPLLRECGPDADRDRRLPARAAEAMRDAGLYRLSVAEPFGGLAADPETLVRTIEAVSWADSAAGWNLMIGLETAGIASGFISDEGGHAIWGERPDVVIAGALRASARAVRKGDGWVVSGRWPFASGCHNAAWFWGGAMLFDEDDRPVMSERGLQRQKQFGIPMASMQILDTWDVAGLRGSGSHDVATEKTFVPDHMTTDVYGSRPRQPAPLFQYPLISRLCFTKVGVGTGITRAAIDTFIGLATEKTPYTATQLLR
jgi:alkylation response protein AidB-like acyl-CoA dehydrogenase